MTVRFYELAVGAGFVWRGQRFEKTAMSMAEDAQRFGSVFLAETEVASDGPLLPAEVAARWKPERGHWAAVIEGLGEKLKTEMGAGLTTKNSEGAEAATSCPSDEQRQPGAAPGGD